MNDNNVNHPSHYQGKHECWVINPDGYYPYCSVCGEESKAKAMTNYCPNCGALMNEKGG